MEDDVLYLAKECNLGEEIVLKSFWHICKYYRKDFYKTCKRYKNIKKQK